MSGIRLSGGIVLASLVPLALGLWAKSISYIDSGEWLLAGLTIFFAALATATTVILLRNLPSSPEPPTGYNYAAYRKVSDPHYVPPREPEEQINKPGFVYIVQAGQYYKIGITQGDVSRRVAQLQTGSPQKIHIVHVIETDCPLDLERDLHKMLAHKRGEGEWFRLSEEELRIIKRLK